MQNRKKTFLLGFSANNLYIFITSIVGIISIPIGVKYFGITRFGIWALILTIVVYLEASNLGVTTAAAALIAKSSGQSERSTIIRRSFVLLTFFSLFTLVSFYSISSYFPNFWDSIMSVPPSVRNEAFQALNVTATLYLLNLPLTVFYSGFIGLQQVHWERFYRVLNSVAGLIAQITVIIIKGNLVDMSAFRGVMILGVSIVAASHYCFFNFTRKDWTDRHVCINEEFSTRSIMISGLRFFSIGVASMLILSADKIIIGKFVSVDAITRYFVTFKPYGIACALIVTANSALWPMYGKAASNDDWTWIQRTYNGFLQFLPPLAGLIWIGGILFSRDIVSIWVNPESYAGTFVTFCLGGYCYVLSIVNTSSQFLAGMNYTKKLVSLAWIELVVTLGLSIVFVKVIHLNGVALAKCLSPALTVLWILPIAVYLKTDRRIKAECGVIVRHFLSIILPLLLISVVVAVKLTGKEIYRYPISLLILTVYVAFTWNITKNVNIHYILLLKNLILRKL